MAKTNEIILGNENYANLHNFIIYSKETLSQEEVESGLDGPFTGRSSQKVVDGFYERLELWVINQASESDTQLPNEQPKILAISPLLTHICRQRHHIIFMRPKFLFHGCCKTGSRSPT